MNLPEVIRNNPEAMKYIEAIAKKDIAVLGDNEMFVMRDIAGEVRAFRRVIRLSSADGTLIQPVYNGSFAVSAQGYVKINEATGAQVAFPPQVLVDGVFQANPYVLRSEAGDVVNVTARAVAFMYTPMGIPIVSDRTVCYDVRKKRTADLLAKADKFPHIFVLLPSELGKESLPADGVWGKFRVSEESNIWVNFKHKEVTDWHKLIVQRELKSVEYAQTFAFRNASKHLHGVQKAPGPEWRLPLVCWRPVEGSVVKWDSKQYVGFQNRVQQMLNGDTRQFGQNTERIEYVQGKDTEADEALDAEMQAEEAIDVPVQENERGVE